MCKIIHSFKKKKNTQQHSWQQQQKHTMEPEIDSPPKFDETTYEIMDVTTMVSLPMNVIGL